MVLSLDKAEKYLLKVARIAPPALKEQIH